MIYVLYQFILTYSHLDNVKLFFIDLREMGFNEAPKALILCAGPPAGNTHTHTQVLNLAAVCLTTMSGLWQGKK